MIPWNTLECCAFGKSTIWKLCKLCEKKHRDFPNLSIGTLLGCSLSEFKSSGGKIDEEANRLFKILVTKSMYFLWKICYEWVINWANVPLRYHSEIEIHNCWLRCINQ
ncbi:hypothetical protein DFH07DRAFT_733466 [Mycena maculata]|uniref:Uncharacterized protein n=1 Tax=Mycena maculata TaxID=230809 RepID=A0AAD7JVQ3_9AGAR|nr:hypothetical protein DFH07DRAFT_733466 [Mycena maculata]